MLGCCGSGVAGMAGSKSIFMAESHLCSGADVPAAGEAGKELRVSADRLGDSLARDVRRRFREERSLSSKGLGRVEQGSEETARSLDGSAVEASAIGLVQEENLGKTALAPQTGELRSGKLGGSFLISQLACGGVL